MDSRLTPQQIGRKIKQLRKHKDLSQEDIARLLNIPRSSVTQIELGNRHVSILELVKLSECLSFSLDEFLSGEYEVVNNPIKVSEPEVKVESVRISKPVLKRQKLVTVLLYILERCGAKPNMGENMITNLLYFCDFNYYEIYEEHLTGLQYVKQASGPSAPLLSEILHDMLMKENLAKIKTKYKAYPQIRYLPLIKADLTRLSASEKDIMDRVIDQFSDWNAHTLNDFAKEDIPWRASDHGNEIDYELVFYRRSPFSVRVYNEDAE